MQERVEESDLLVKNIQISIQQRIRVPQFEKPVFRRVSIFL